MTDNRVTTGTTGSAGQTVAIGLGDPPGDRIVELLAHDGRITTIVQRPDGHLMIRTDGLREVSYAVYVAPDCAVTPGPSTLL